jgi:putative endonuclease
METLKVSSVKEVRVKRVEVKAHSVPRQRGAVENSYPVQPPTTFMFYVYVLRSARDGLLYIGQTRDLRKRFAEHNAAKITATKYRVPFQLIYYEAYSSRRDADRREKRLKKFKNSYAELKKRLLYSLKT